MPAIIFADLTFRDSHAPSCLHTHIAAMAPVTTIPQKANNHQRYLPQQTKNATNLPSDVDLEESDNEAGALQPVNEPQEADWEGLGGEEETNNSEDGDESDADSIEIQVEPKKQEKPILPKDAEEEELERIVFGDSAGFKQGLEDFSLDHTAGTYGGHSEDDQDDEEDVEGVADQDLFFFDTGPIAAPAGSVAVNKREESEDEDDRPAWDDSDDERLVVSLASVPQLRKLRETVDDDVVNGKEYSRRLRKQYQRLYPTPDWAIHATGKANKKRQRNMDDEESDEGSASDMDMDDEDVSSQPLARLLKDADILSRNARGPTKRRKLQAGTVDIQRLKDVMKAGPVSISLHHLWPFPLIFYLVCRYLTLIPSHLPTPAFLWPQFNPVPSSRQSQSAEPQPPSHILTHQAHPTHHNRISSLSF
jgi:U3 small nucleolar RNA-associated protein 18